MGKLDNLQVADWVVKTVADSNDLKPVERQIKRDVLHVLAPGLYVMSGRYDQDGTDKYNSIEIVHATKLESEKFQVK